MGSSPILIGKFEGGGPGTWGGWKKLLNDARWQLVVEIAVNWAKKVKGAQEMDSLV
jgi:hypothetical protein